MTQSTPWASSVNPALARPRATLVKLEELRRRRRRLRGLDGFLRFLAVVLFIAWGTFLLDWTLELPKAIRLFHLLAAGALCAALIRVFFLSQRRRLSESQLAAHVEAADGRFDQALITAVELTAPDNPRASLYSPELLARTVREAESKMSDVKPVRLLSRRGLNLSLGIVVLLLVPLLSGSLARPDLAGTYVLRNLLMSDEPWPREYLLRVLEPTARDTLVAMGDSFSVLVKQERGGDAPVKLDAVFAGGQREPFSLEKLQTKGEHQFRKLFRNVDRDFAFTVSAGDYTSREYRVSVRNRPRIEEIALAFDYPDYTGLPDVTEPEAGLGGHVKVPLGTQVRYMARTSLPVQSAEFVRSFRSQGEEKNTRAAIEVNEGRMLKGQFEADVSGSYHFRLISEDDFENPNPIRYRIAVVPDQAPGVQITKPGKNSEVGVRARVAIEIEADDDYGVEATTLVFRDVGEEGEAAAEVEIPLDGFEPGTRKVGESFILDLDAWVEDHGGWKPQEGNRIEYFAQAVDAIDQLGASRVYSMTVISEEDLERILQDEIGLVAERLKEAHDSQRETRQELERVLEETRLASGKVPTEEMPNLRHSRLGQEKINVRLEESLEHFQEIIDRVIENRLTGVKELPWIQELRKELEEITDTLAPKALRGLDELSRKTSGETAETPDVEQALSYQRDNERAIGNLLQKLTEWGDLRTVIRQMEELRNTQRELQEKIEERAKSSLSPDGREPR